MKKQCKSSITKNHKVTQNFFFFYGVPLKGYVAFYRSASQIHFCMICSEETSLIMVSTISLVDWLYCVKRQFNS